MYEKTVGRVSGNRGAGFYSAESAKPEVSSNRQLNRLTACDALGGLATDDAGSSPTKPLHKQFVLECVRSSPLFAGLSAAAELEVAQSAIERFFPNREIIFREDDPIRFVDVIGSGSVKITQLSREGGEVILRVDRAGYPIDGMGDMSDEVHTTTAYAVRNCCMLSWDVQVFANLIERFPMIQRNATAIVRRRLKMLEECFCDISTARVPQRLARLLLRMTADDRYSAPYLLGLSREELAQMIGTTPFTISRLLREWAERQIVYVSRSGVIIENLETLIRLAGETDSNEESWTQIA